MEPRDTIRIASEPFKIAKKNGVLAYQVSQRPSEPGDPGKIEYAEWRVDGPDFFTYEGPNGYLGRDYGVNTDGRWEGIDTLGPKIETLTLSTYDIEHTGSELGGTSAELGVTMMLGGAVDATDADGIALVQANGTTYAYINRGQIPAKVDLSGPSLKNANVTLPAAATSIISTKSQLASNPREVSIAVGESHPYRVLSQGNIGSGSAPDAWTVNDDGETARIFGIAPDRTVLISDKTVKGNIQTGSVTMSSPTWNTVATLTNLDATATGFGLDGSFWTIGTSKGPAFLDKDTAEFTLLMPEIDESTENCRNMAPWFEMGLVVPLRNGSRFLKGGYGRSWGVENFNGNASPVSGFVTGGDGSTRWYLQAVYTPSLTVPPSGDTYLVMWRPRIATDPHPHPYSPHVIAKFTNVRCRFIKYLGASLSGAATGTGWMGGYGGNVFYFASGDTAREIDSNGYQFSPTGTTYLTELRRQPSCVKDIEAFEFETSGCATGGGGVTDSSVKIYVSVDGATATQVGSTITTNGFHRNFAGVSMYGRKVKPEIRYEKDTVGAGVGIPAVLGTLRMRYRARPVLIDVYKVEVELPESTNAKTDLELQEHLMTQWGTGPVAINDGPDQLSAYVRVDSVKVMTVYDSVGGDTSTRGHVRLAEVQMTEWLTA